MPVADIHVLLKMALRGIEWVELAFPDVNMHVNVPEEVWSHALLRQSVESMAPIRVSKSFSGTILVGGEVAKGVEQIKEGTTFHDGPSGYLEIAPFIGLFELLSTFGDV